MARVLIGTMAFAGHVNPALPIARKLIERGNQVWWYCGEKYRNKIEATGATFLKMKAGYDFDDADLDAAFPGRSNLKGLPKLKFDIKNAFVGAVPGHTEDLDAAVPEIKPDVILVDNAFAAAVPIHARTGIPWASFSIMPLGLPSVDTPPAGLGILPVDSALGRLRNRALYFLFNKLIFRDVNAYGNEIMKQVGLPPIISNVFEGTLSPYLYLQPTDPAFEYPRRDLPSQLHFIGPFLPGPSKDFDPSAYAWWDEMVDGGRPVVHVTQGTVTTESEQLLIPAIKALTDENVLVVVTTGGKPVETLGLTELPANVRVESFIPHYHLLSHVSVMVTNGGYGGVQIALANSVPLVVAGATEDKPEVANRVAWSGTGINLKTNTPTEEQVREAVRKILADPVYRDNARALGAKLNRYDAATEASALLERLAQSRQPILRNAPRATGEMKAAPAV
jgi:UDP:flavonoid glycosyltransferase YjiC (YdhE family)